MAINVVPVTGAGGGVGAPQQGKSSAGRLQLTPYVAPKSGLSAFGDSFNPYMIQAMKTYQDTKKRKEIGAMKSLYDAGDKDAFNKGDNPYPGVGMEYESALAKQEELKQNRLSNEQMKILMYENRMNVQGLKGVQKEAQISQKGDIDSQLAKEAHGYSLESMTKKSAVDHSLLSAEARNKMALLKTGIESKEKMQGVQNNFEYGQVGNKAAFVQTLQRIKGRQQMELQDSGHMDNQEIANLQAGHKKELQSSELAYKEGALNKDIDFKTWETNTVTGAKREIEQLKERGATNRAEMNNAMKFDVAKLTDYGQTERAVQGIVSREGMQVKELTQAATLAERAEKYGLRKQRDAQAHKIAFQGIEAKHKFDTQRIDNEAKFLLSKAERDGNMDRLVYSEEWKTNRAMMANVNKKEMNSANIAGRSELGLKLAEIKATSSEKVADKALEAKKFQFEMSSSKDAFGRFDKISNKWEKEAKEFKSMQTSYSKVTNSLVDKEGNAKTSYAGDVSLIYNYMKMLDPGSVVHVREGQLMQDWGGLPGELVKLYNYVAGKKQKLAPEVREDYADRARELFTGAHDQYLVDHKRYRKMATDWGLDPDETIVFHSKIGMLPDISGVKLPSEPGMGANLGGAGDLGNKAMTILGGKQYKNSDFTIGEPIR